jgi:prepilin-type N-terminal cleavage/methylation domain-containing protein
MRITNRRRPSRRGFNLIELLIALAISSALLTATMVALDASFTAYQATTEYASTHTIGRLSIQRLLTLIRTGREFGPFPLNPHSTIVESDYIEFLDESGNLLVIEWRPDEEALYVQANGSDYLLLEGVLAQFDPDDPDVQIPPFTLEYERGRTLYRATVDLLIKPDDNMDVEIEGNYADTIHIVASAMPRSEAYGEE